MNYFLELFGEMNIGWAAVVVGAGIFLWGCYKKVGIYFSDKAIREREKDERIQTVMELLEKIRAENGENKATTYRYRILRFDDEIRHGTKHSKEHFDQIIEDVDEYEEYCSGHPEYRNNKAVMAIENIKRVYQNCANEGTFL